MVLSYYLLGIGFSLFVVGYIHGKAFLWSKKLFIYLFLHVGHRLVFIVVSVKHMLEDIARKSTLNLYTIYKCHAPMPLLGLSKPKFAPDKLDVSD